MYYNENLLSSKEKEIEKQLNEFMNKLKKYNMLSSAIPVI